ncbi:MAG: hypothetical protein ACRCU5_00665 [Rhizobiaceae bacterium]
MTNETHESDDQFKERKRLAERAHDQNDKAEEVHAGQIEAFSIAAMRAPGLAAAGGIAAALGFFSANYSVLKHTTGATELFNAMIGWFFLALIFAVLAPGAAYFSQLAYQDSLQRRTKTYEHPFVTTTKGSDMAEQVGNFFRWFTVIVNLGAIVAICFGGYKFWKLLNLM